MREAQGNLWHLAQTAQAVVITTNGTVKASGEAVMGRGTAKQAAERYPYIKPRLGGLISRYGNHVNVVWVSPEQGARQPLICFPVKHAWWRDADPYLIERSAEELEKLVDQTDWRTIVMPRPGCGNGGLDWASVRPVIEPFLDDRFTVVQI